MDSGSKKSWVKVFLWSIIAIGFGLAFSALVVQAFSEISTRTKTQTQTSESLTETTGNNLLAQLKDFKYRTFNRAKNIAGSLNFSYITQAPVRKYHLEDESLRPHVGALAYVVGDADTGQIIISKNGDTVSPIASVTKLMTALTSLESLDQSETTKVSRKAVETLGQSGLSQGDRMKISDLIYPLLLVSSNDASEVLAEHAGREKFLGWMNQHAKDIGMENTNFNDPSGLSAKNSSTAEDLFSMAHYLFTKHRTVFNITNLERYSAEGRTWVNANRFSRRDDYLGGKTGYTDAAHRTGVFIFSSPIANGEIRNIAIALLKTDDRVSDINRILDYVKENVYYSYENSTQEKESEVTLGFVGDIMLDRGVKTSIIKNFGGNYEKILAEAPRILQPDIMFGNLEGPISDKGTKIGSIYSFRMDPLSTKALKEAGFDVLSFANNHVGDYSTPAFLDTLGRLKEENILYVGAGENHAEASRATIVERDGVRIGYLAMSDVGPEFMKATEEKMGILLASDKNLDAIVKEAKELSDILVVSVHWGDEYKPHNKKQEVLAKRLIDNGANIVVGHHPHVPQDVVNYKDGLIFYSLGNFVFDQYFSKETMGGLYAEVVVTKKGIKSHTETPFVINEKYQPILGNKKTASSPSTVFERGSCPVGNSETNETFTNVSNKKSVGKYIPENLVEISKVIPTKEGREICLLEESAVELEKMIVDAKNNNVDISITSGFRSFEIQEILYENRNTTAEEESIAIPGHSEHQLGTTIDITSTEIGNASASTLLKNTKAFEWMSENAHKYGFVMSYPENRDTGYIFEPWHWRYVGAETAKEIKTKNLTIQQYLEEI